MSNNSVQARVDQHVAPVRLVHDDGHGKLVLTQRGHDDGESRQAAQRATDGDGHRGGDEESKVEHVDWHETEPSEEGHDDAAGRNTVR